MPPFETRAIQINTAEINRQLAAERAAAEKPKKAEAKPDAAAAKQRYLEAQKRVQHLQGLDKAEQDARIAEYSAAINGMTQGHDINNALVIEDGQQTRRAPQGVAQSPLNWSRPPEIKKSAANQRIIVENPNARIIQDGGVAVTKPVEQFQGGIREISPEIAALKRAAPPRKQEIGTRENTGTMIVDKPLPPPKPQGRLSRWLKNLFN